MSSIYSVKNPPKATKQDDDASTIQVDNNAAAGESHSAFGISSRYYSIHSYAYTTHTKQYHSHARKMFQKGSGNLESLARHKKQGGFVRNKLLT